MASGLPSAYYRVTPSDPARSAPAPGGVRADFGRCRIRCRMGAFRSSGQRQSKQRWVSRRGGRWALAALSQGHLKGDLPMYTLQPDSNLKTNHLVAARRWGQGTMGTITYWVQALLRGDENIGNQREAVATQHGKALDARKLCTSKWLIEGCLGSSGGDPRTMEWRPASGSALSVLKPA